MTIEISLQDFRGFRQQPYVPIRPITLLVGENSAGKTSFLAGMKFILDFISGRGEPSFNSDPFQMGTYDQIAHFRGGRGGRAREFRISIRQSIVLRKSRLSETSGTFNVELQLSLGSVESHAAVTSVRVSSQQKSLEATLVADGVQITYTNEKKERFPLNETVSVPPVAKADFARYWPFLLRDLSFRIRRKGDDQPTLFDLPAEVVVQMSDLADGLARQSVFVEATSAIRTKPQRTYTPGTESADGEGSHVPYEIAKRYRSRSRDRNAWEELKEAIESYGMQSAMFREMSVKSFGQTASDPFQIQFSSDGPKTNLVDLGYGTSQVLPILYMISTARRGGYFLIQQPEVHLHPRAQAALGQHFVDSYCRKGARFVLETHSDFIVDRVRRAIGDGVIKREDVSLLFFERQRLENQIFEIELDGRGDPIDPPDCCRRFFIDEEMGLLGI